MSRADTMLGTIHKCYNGITELDEQLDELGEDYLNDIVSESEYDNQRDGINKQRSHCALNLSSAFAELERLIVEDGDVPTEWSHALG